MLAAVGQPAGIHKIRVASVNDVSYVVSWTTDSATTGSVRYGATTVLELGLTPDALNPTASTTHYVTITDLAPNTTYYFDVVAGGQTDDNNGMHYTVTTGPTLNAEPGVMVYGQVFAPGGVVGLDHVIVYLLVQRAGSASQTIALRTADGGYWGYSLGNLRAADHQTLFDPATGESIQITVQGGAYGAASFSAPTPAETGSIGNVTMIASPDTMQKIYLPSVGVRVS